jgi:dolichol-phosphate mannosyltransferase
MVKEVLQSREGFATLQNELINLEVNKQRKITKSDIWQFLRFCMVGSLNAVIDFAVLNILLWLYPTGDIWRVLEYNSFAVLMAATNSFFWNKYWTFKQRHPITRQEVFRFAVLTCSTVLMNDLLIELLARIFPGLMNSALIGSNILKLGAIIGTTSVSFFGMRLWVFFQRKHGGVTAQPNLQAQSASLEAASDIATFKLRVQKVMKTLIIIPTYNERENLPLLLEGIFKYAPQTDVLIVDDNSPDGTGHLAEEMRRQDRRIHVMHRPGKLGLGTAYIAGFKHAIAQNYDAAFEMDADFSHDPRHLPDFLKTIQQADLVIGSRYIPGGSTPGWSASRRLISGCGNIFARFMLGIPVHDCTGGYRCYRREVLQCIDLDAVQSRGYAFQVEMTYRVLKQKFTIVETPITFRDRLLGTSKMSRKIVIEAFTYVLRTRFSDQSALLKSARRDYSRTENTVQEYVMPVAPSHISLPVVPLDKMNDPQRTRLRPVMLQRL